MRAFGITDVGSVRHQNQDAYFHTADADGGVALVCDGMGGARAGNVASRLAAETFIQTLGSREGEPDALLTQALAEANRRVYRRAEEDEDCRGMGTTLVAALVTEGTAHIINVGDSRAYYITGAGIEQITRDHSVVQDLVARGDITQEQARQHPGKNLITRALGAEPEVRGDLFHRQMEPGGTLLLCSDGMSNVVTEQEMLYEVIHGGPIDQCCQRMLDIALGRGAPDNVTAVLLQMEQPDGEVTTWTST